ncbi:hypothetical protein GGR56DRAFT_650118 [Xylariaceae sp. FL0804]|nr:hypothetical protein GGR56DRAFT_650118 [Xylariaceae sp. FL0804]
MSLHSYHWSLFRRAWIQSIASAFWICLQRLVCTGRAVTGIHDLLQTIPLACLPRYLHHMVGGGESWNGDR